MLYNIFFEKKILELISKLLTFAADFQFKWY